MVIDSPDPRPFTYLLVGAWWPALPTQLEEAAAYWQQHSQVKNQERQQIRNDRLKFGKSNTGHTAEDMMTRLAIGERRLLDVAAHCQRKSEANKRLFRIGVRLRAR